MIMFGDPSRRSRACGVSRRMWPQPRSRRSFSLHGAAGTHCNAFWRPYDCARVGSQPVHGLRRGSSGTSSSPSSTCCSRCSTTLRRRGVARLRRTSRNSARARSSSGQARTPRSAAGDEVDTPTLGFQRVIQRAKSAHVQSTGREKAPVTSNAGRHFRREGLHAVYCLHQQGNRRSRRQVNFTLHGIKSPIRPEPA